jgi:hypothetical protein
MRRLLIPLVAIAAACAAPAGAAPITFHFSGTISYIDPPLGAPFVYGQSGSGSFQIESTTVDPSPGAGASTYRGATSFSFTFGTYTATSPGGTLEDYVQVVDRGADIFEVHAVGVSGATVLDWYVPTHLGILLNDADGTAFSSVALPTSFDLSEFGYALAYIDFGSPDPGDLASVILTLTSLTVPEPGAPLLLALIAGLVHARQSSTLRPVVARDSRRSSSAGSSV